MAVDSPLLYVFIALLCVKIELVDSQYDQSEISAKDAFEQNELVPQFVSTGPESTACVFYPTGGHYVDLGNQIEPEHTMRTPTVDWDADSDAFYTLIMFDADETISEKTFTSSPYVHWLIINIPGNDPKGGKTCVTYEYPDPSPGPPHRYTFVIFKQSGRMTNDLHGCYINFTARRHLSIVNYTSQQNMSGPVAGNFFFEENICDDCPSLL